MRLFRAFFSLIVLSLIFIPTVYANNHTFQDTAGLNWIQDTIRRIVTLISGLAFVALVVVLVMSGIKYLTSGGESKSLQSAHQSITWALLGMLFLIISWLILLLIEAFTGLKLSIFDIKILCGTVPSPAPLGTIMPGC